MTALGPSIPDPGNSPSSQLATLLALTSAVRALQNSVSTLSSSNEGLKQTITATSNNGSASITEERIVRADADSSLAEQILTLTAEFNGNSATVAQTFKAYADANSAMAQQLLTLNATVDANEISTNAAITSEQTARANGDSALATSITNLSATVTSNYNTVTASISSEQTARANADSALSTSITNLSATVTNNYNTLSANISTEQTARANGDTANANAISSLTATVGSNTSSITTNANAIATINGKLSASYGVTLDVNGYMTGFNLLSTGAGTGSFDIRADIMRLVMPGYSPQPVMVINNLNGTPTLTFNGNIIADNTLNNNALADGAVGHSGSTSGFQDSGALNLTVFGRRAVILFVAADGASGLGYGPKTVTVTANGTTIATPQTVVISNVNTGSGLSASSTDISLPMMVMIAHTPSGAGTVTYRATGIVPGNITLTAIELGA